MHAKLCPAFAAMSLLLCVSNLLAAPKHTVPVAATSVHLYLANASTSVTPEVFEAIRSELEDVMAFSGTAVIWHDGKSDVSGPLAVMRFEGVCDADAPLPFSPAMAGSRASQDPEALGKTHISNGEVLPYADIRCNQIRRFIAGELRADSKHREQMLGRAVARVIAHELYHILLKTRSHEKNGIARASQTPAQLVAPRLSFAGDEFKTIQTE